MKKLIISSLILGSIACVSFAFSKDWNGQYNWENGHQRFVAELNLDAERAEQMESILDSYREVPKLYFTHQSEKIPEFLAKKEAELAALLTPEELAQFKQSFGEWAKKKNFKFIKFSQYQPQSLNPIPEYPLLDTEAVREEIRQTINRDLIEIRRQLSKKTPKV
jgi:hypothetical protein